MYKYSICVFVYLTLNNLVPDYFTDHVRIKDTPYFTRYPNHICTKEHIPIKSYSSDIISVTSCRLLNNLPNELTNCVSLNSFKYHLKNIYFLCNNCIFFTDFCYLKLLS